MYIFIYLIFGNYHYFKCEFSLISLLVLFLADLMLDAEGTARAGDLP